MNSPDPVKLEERLREAFPELTDDDFGYHHTDLYVRHSIAVWRWLKTHYAFHANCSVFVSLATDERWIDIPFAGNWPVPRKETTQ